MPATTKAKMSVPSRYMELIGEFPLRRITTAAVHARAKGLVLRLSSGKLDRGAADYLDVLVDLIADFEKRSGQTIDTGRTSAADIVRHRIEERGLSISALARLIGLPQSNLSEMLSGKRDWSKTAICGLSSHLNIRADRFLA
jgi:antitoxin component HigA of HigAB toxin-antitoxin module